MFPYPPNRSVVELQPAIKSQSTHSFHIVTKVFHRLIPLTQYFDHANPTGHRKYFIVSHVCQLRIREAVDVSESENRIPSVPSISFGLQNKENKADAKKVVANYCYTVHRIDWVISRYHEM